MTGTDTVSVPVAQDKAGVDRSNEAVDSRGYHRGLHQTSLHGRSDTHDHVAKHLISSRIGSTSGFR